MYADAVTGIVTGALSHLPWLAFLLLAGFWALFSLVAVYHFARYGMGSIMMWAGIGLYGVLSISLLSSMLYALSLLTA